MMTVSEALISCSIITILNFTFGMKLYLTYFIRCMYLSNNCLASLIYFWVSLTPKVNKQKLCFAYLYFFFCLKYIKTCLHIFMYFVFNFLYIY